MAAPAFTTPQVLRADLTTLGYPDVTEKSVHPHGEARLAVLTWLARQADPTFAPSSPDQLAQFWDDLGIHSAPPNNNGYRIPFTAPSDRVRDKNAANYFLRAAIDLVFAFHTRRAEDPLSALWAQNSDETSQSDDPLSKFDADAMAQLDVLIEQRHLLFPGTTKLFQRNPAKKRPLHRRPVNTNGDLRVIRRQNKPDKGQNSAVPSREQVMDRLRNVQRKAQDLQVEIDQAHGRQLATGAILNEVDDCALLDDSTIVGLAEDAKALQHLAEQFDLLTSDSLLQRANRESPAQRNEHMEQTLNSLAKECVALEENVQNSFQGTQRCKAAIEEILRSKPLIEGLPHSAPVREAVRRRDRTEAQTKLNTTLY